VKTIQVLGDGIGAVTLLNVSGDDKGIVRSARISFDQQNDFTELNDKDAKLIKYLLEHHHGSPFEHNLIQYEVTCPIFVDRQFVRHRIGVAKNENSARYSEVKERFYVPNDPRRQATNNRQASVEDTDEAGELKKFGSILYRHAIENAYAVYA
jgi:thymidylate synthase (FAD)